MGDQLVDHAVGQPLGAGLRYPEQATLLRAERNGTIAALVVEYGTSDAVGRVRVQATPKVVIEDKFLTHLRRTLMPRCVLRGYLPRRRSESFRRYHAGSSGGAVWHDAEPGWWIVRVTDQALRVLVLAAEAAHDLGDKPVNGYHLLLGLAASEGGARHVLGSDAARLRDAPRPPPADVATAKDIVDSAVGLAYASGRDRATTADVLRAVLGPADGPIASLLRAAGVEPATIRAAAAESDHGACCRETGVSDIRLLLAEMGSHAERMPGRGRAAAGMAGGLIPYLLLWSAVLAVTWDTSGPELVLAAGGATMLLALLVGSINLRRRTSRSMARATVTLPLPGNMRPLLHRLGLRQLEVRIQSEPAWNRCYQSGRRAWIVLGEGTERTPAAARFVLWHEVAHLARRDITARRLGGQVSAGLVVGAVTSFDPRAVAIAVIGAALLTVGGRWWSELACDRFAVRHGGPAGFHAWVAVVRGTYAVLRQQRKLPRWAGVKGLFTHPPLAIRAAVAIREMATAAQPTP